MAQLLIIDDDDDNRHKMKQVLEQAGHSVSEAANGEEGLAVAYADSPDFIVLDVIMPKLDGWQVCRNLKNHPLTKSIPVIVVTGSDSQIDELHAWECGADGYASKHDGPEKILKILNELKASRLVKAKSS